VTPPTTGDGIRGTEAGTEREVSSYVLEVVPPSGALILVGSVLAPNVIVRIGSKAASAVFTAILPGSLVHAVSARRAADPAGARHRRHLQRHPDLAAMYHAEGAQEAFLAGDVLVVVDPHRLEDRLG
jgi:hypothetical protein